MSTEQQLREVLKQYDEAADKFIQKVETGQARSVETYKELKAAREASTLVKEGQ